jgi:hypothetical protein
MSFALTVFIINAECRKCNSGTPNCPPETPKTKKGRMKAVRRRSEPVIVQLQHEGAGSKRKFMAENESKAP